MWLHLLNTCVFNAHILYCKLGGDLDPFRFRKNLISQIIEKYGSDTENTPRGGRPSLCENPFRLVKRHFPSYVRATKKNKMCLDTVLYVGKEEHVKNPGTDVFDVT